MTIFTNQVFTTLAAVAECLCAEIQKPEYGVPDVCFCGVVPGEIAAIDYIGDCDDVCGMAWVRLVNLYPMVTLGQPDPTEGNCAKQLGIDMEVGIMRCIGVGDEQGNPPSPDELLTATELQVADALIMRSAIFCCAAIPNRDVILGVYTPLGPQGGVVGGTWTLQTGF